MVLDGDSEHVAHIRDEDPDSLIFGPPDPDPEPTCNNGFIKIFLSSNKI